MRRSFHLFSAFVFIFFSLYVPCHADGISETAGAGAEQGYKAFRNEDWVSAAVFLRKAVSYPENLTDENYFMLVKSEIYSGEYKMAEEDCGKFLSLFPFSPYVPHIQYQKGRMLHLLGKNEEAVLALNDFCRQHYDDELYPLALFWIAESFYDEYDFDSAEGIYRRIVSDFPNCEKVRDSHYRLDLIARRAREEKLLYLLKMLGEENLSMREEYERQLKSFKIQEKIDQNTDGEK